MRFIFNLHTNNKNDKKFHWSFNRRGKFNYEDLAIDTAEISLYSRIVNRRIKHGVRPALLPPTTGYATPPEESQYNLLLPDPCAHHAPTCAVTAFFPLAPLLDLLINKPSVLSISKSARCLNNPLKASTL